MLSFFFSPSLQSTLYRTKPEYFTKWEGKTCKYLPTYCKELLLTQRGVSRCLRNSRTRWGCWGCCWQTEGVSPYPESRRCVEKAQKKTHVKGQFLAGCKLASSKTEIQCCHKCPELNYSGRWNYRVSNQTFFCFSIISQTFPKSKCVLDGSASLDIQRRAIFSYETCTLFPRVPTRKESLSNERHEKGGQKLDWFSCVSWCKRRACYSTSLCTQTPAEVTAQSWMLSLNLN